MKTQCTITRDKHGIMTKEELGNALVIGKAGATVIGALVAILITLVGYIYVQDRVEQQKQDEKIERRLDMMDIQLDIMTDCLLIIDPEIKNKVWRQRFESVPRSYRGVKKKE